MHTPSSGSKPTVLWRTAEEAIRSSTVVSSQTALFLHCPGSGRVELSPLDLMMPQPMDHRLVCLLLPWITILSICQMSFIAFFFTAVYPGSFQNISDVTPKATPRRTDNNTQPYIQSKPKPEMMNFKATPGGLSDTIEWTADKEVPDLLSSKNKMLTFQQDGYYFLFLQVTLNLSQEQQNKGDNYTFTLSKKEEKNSVILLQVTVNTKLSISTGTMCKIVHASATESLEVTIKPRAQVNSNSFSTQLGVLFLPE